MKKTAEKPESAEHVPSLGRALEVAAGIAVLAALAAAAARQIAAVDFWWQLATGSWVVENGWPRHDAFSYTATDRPWIELRWLYCVGLHLLVEGVGPAAAVAAKVAVIVGTLLLAAATALTRRTVSLALMLLLVATIAMADRLYLRPELVSGLFVALFLALIHRERVRGGRAIFALPVLQIVWVNSHTVFVLGPAIVGAWWVAEWIERFTGIGPHRDAEGRSTRRDGTRRAAVILGLTGVACLVNPWFFQGALLPWELFRQLGSTAYSTEISELRPTFEVGHGADHWAYVVLLVVAGLALFVARSRVDPFFTIVTAAMAWLSFSAVRNVPLFVVSVLPFALASAAELRLRAGPSPNVRRIVHHAACVAMAVIGLSLTWAFATDRFSRSENHRFGLAVNPFVHPEAAVDFLEERGVIGERTFNYLNEGAYLLFRGYPVYFDPRLEVHGEERLFAYRRATSSVEAFEAEYERYGFPIVFIGYGSPSLIAPKLEFARQLTDTGAWRLAYVDHRVFVLLRDGFAPEVGALDLEGEGDAWRQRWRRVLPRVDARSGEGSTAARLPVGPYAKLGVALSTLGAWELAEPFLLDAGSLAPSDGLVQQNLALVAFRQKEYALAEERYERLESLVPPGGARRGAERMKLLARGYRKLADGRRDEAIRDIEAAAKLTGGDPALERLVEQLRGGASLPPSDSR
jgi:tetratricopeptide (TPR) repeat protein